MKFLDMFAGIGGFRFAMEQAGHECVGFCEIDKFARASYKAIHDTKGEIELHDVTQVTDEEIRSIGTVDVICGGFPCQAFSIAGNRRGFEDTRGTLFFEVARFASILKPKYLFLENVKGLLNHDNGNTFEVIISTLDELGYNVEWQVLNSKNFGVPQNRERVFIIASLRGECTRRVFPIGREGAKFGTESTMKVIGNTKNPSSTSNGARERVYDSEGLMSTLTATDYKSPKQVAIPVLTPERVNKRQNGRRFKEDGEPMFTLTAQDKHGIMIVGKLPGNHSQTSRVYSTEGIAPTITTMSGGGHEPKIIQRGHGYNKGGEHNIAPTLTSNSYHDNNYLSVGFRIRKLTPRECWRLQGYSDWAFEKAQQVNSNSQLYKQAGNSVTVNVVVEIAKRL